jgi:hypothetical protein
MVAAKISNLNNGQHATSIDVAVAQPQAAGMLNVSVNSVKRAKKVQESGDASLIADVEAGKVTVSAGAQHVSSRPCARGSHVKPSVRTEG